MKITRTALTKPTPTNHLASSKISFSGDSPSPSGRLLKTGLVVGGSALAGAAILNPDKVGQVVDTIGSSVGPALSVLAPIAQGAVEGGMAGIVAGAGYGMLATAGRTDSSPAYATIGGMMGGVVVGGLVGGVAGAVGVSPLIAAPVVIAGAALIHYRG